MPGLTSLPRLQVKDCCFPLTPGASYYVQVADADTHDPATARVFVLSSLLPNDPYRVMFKSAVAHNLFLVVELCCVLAPVNPVAAARASNPDGLRPVDLGTTAPPERTTATWLSRLLACLRRIRAY